MGGEGFGRKCREKIGDGGNDGVGGGGGLGGVVGYGGIPLLQPLSGGNSGGNCRLHISKHP